jgi:hypothetical protein
MASLFDFDLVAGGTPTRSNARRIDDGMIDAKGNLSTEGTHRLLVTVANLKQKLCDQEVALDENTAKLVALQQQVDHHTVTMGQKLANLEALIKDENTITRESTHKLFEEIKAQLHGLKAVPHVAAAAAPKQIQNPIFLPGDAQCIVFGDSHSRVVQSYAKFFSAKTVQVHSPDIYHAMNSIERVCGPRGSKLKPGVIFFIVGTNDIPDRHPLSWYADRLEELSDRCNAGFPGVPAYFLTPPPRTDDDDYNRRTRELCEHLVEAVSPKPNFTILDMSAKYAEVSIDRLLRSDGIHLRDDGAVILAEAVNEKCELLVKPMSFRDRVSNRERVSTNQQGAGYDFSSHPRDFSEHPNERIRGRGGLRLGRGIRRAMGFRSRSRGRGPRDGGYGGWQDHGRRDEQYFY